MPSKQTTTRRLHVTDRHAAIIKGLQTYRLLQESTIHRLYFPTIKEGRNVHDKLDIYRKRGYVVRRDAPQFRGAASNFIDFVHQDRAENIYFLGKTGADLLGEPYDRRYEGMDLYHLYHRTDIQEARLCLELSLQAQPNITLARWMNEHDRDKEGDFPLHQEVKFINKATDKKERLPLWPDAAFVLHDQATGKEDFFFLEVDEGREDIAKKWKKKIVAYRAFGYDFDPKAWSFNGKGFRVLTLNRSQTGKEPEKRKANLITAARSFGGKKQFYFATFKDLMPDDQVTSDRFLTAPIWQRAEADDPDDCPSLRLTDYLFGRDQKDK